MRSHLVWLCLLAACSADPSTELDELTAALSAPPELAVPAGNHLRAAYRAFGFQIYECSDGAWTFRAPLALVVAEDDSLVAIHYGGIDSGLPAGPYWQSTRDKSRVHGGGAVSAPNPGAIPLLRLRGLDSAGDGLFTAVTFIQRLATTGGLAPTGKCRKNAPRAYVPYTAEYTFWGASLPRPPVPDTIAVPEGHDVAFIGRAEGVQIYECVPDATSALAWKLRAPSALLDDHSGTFADHFGGIDWGMPAGPYWRSLRDGSQVHGGNALSSPNAGAIPLLRLQALDRAGHGIFSRISFIHRLATSGGTAPATPCAFVYERAELPYTADYYFYVPTI
jgi:hypothetical protein